MAKDLETENKKAAEQKRRQRESRSQSPRRSPNKSPDRNKSLPSVGVKKSMSLSLTSSAAAAAAAAAAATISPGMMMMSSSDHGIPNKKLVEVVPSFWQDARALAELALPTLVIEFSFVLPPFAAASVIGRLLGVVYLDGYALAWGTGNLSTLALLQGVFNACDTLGPRAFAAGDYKRVGVTAMQGFLASLLVIGPTNVLVALMLPRILHFLGQDEEVSKYACEFYVPYALCFPMYALYNVLWRFLSAQNILAPLVVSTLVGVCILLPLSLHYFVQWFGFVGAAWALVWFYFMDCFMVLAWLQWNPTPQQADVWPGFASVSRDARASLAPFLTLVTGAMLAYLEWTYWEVLTVMIGTFGVMPLSAHEVPRQLTDMGYVVPMGTALALALRMGATLPRNVAHAKALAFRTFLVSTVLFGSAALVMYGNRDFLISLFTSEPQAVHLAQAIWNDACIYFFAFSMFGITNGISIGLGMQWTFGTVTLAGMWAMGMPTTYYFAVIRKGGLQAVWACIWPPYIFIIITMILAFVTKDWSAISKQIRMQASVEMKNMAKDVEALQLLLQNSSSNGNDNNHDSSLALPAYELSAVK